MSAPTNATVLVPAELVRGIWSCADWMACGADYASGTTSLWDLIDCTEVDTFVTVPHLNTLDVIPRCKCNARRTLRAIEHTLGACSHELAEGDGWKDTEEHCGCEWHQLALMYDWLASVLGDTEVDDDFAAMYAALPGFHFDGPFVRWP